MVLALVLGGAVLLPQAAAIDHGPMGTLSPEATSIDNDYPPMSGTYPNVNDAPDPFAYFRPPMCRTVTYCDAHELGIDYPGGDEYLTEHFVRVTITLSWDNHRTEDNPTGNDLDLFVWGDDGPAAGGPVSKCGSPSDANCDFIHPEVVTLTDPSDTVPEEEGEERDPLFLTVVSHQGLNTGYNISAQFEEFSLPPPPDFERPDREVSSAGGSESAATPRPASGSRTADDLRSPTVSGPDTEPRAEVLIPGPDGELVPWELPVLAAGDITEPIEPSTFNPLVPAGILSAIIGVATVVLILRRRREEREAEGY